MSGQIDVLNKLYKKVINLLDEFLSSGLVALKTGGKSLEIGWPQGVHFN